MGQAKFFDEPLEVEYYELWHHEGRRARMGVAMMAPDYPWWFGFYECKKRFNAFMEEANHMLETGENPTKRKIIQTSLVVRQNHVKISNNK